MSQSIDSYCVYLLIVFPCAGCDSHCAAVYSSYVGAQSVRIYRLRDHRREYITLVRIHPEVNAESYAMNCGDSRFARQPGNGRSLSGYATYQALESNQASED